MDDAPIHTDRRCQWSPDITLGFDLDVPLAARFTQGEVLGFALYVLRLAALYPRPNGPGLYRAFYRTTVGWEFMSFPGGNPTDGKLTVERKAACAACHANRKDHDFVFSEFRT